MVSKAKTPSKKVKKELGKLRKSLRSESKKAKALKKSISAVKKRADNKVRSVTAKTVSLKKEMDRLRDNMQSLSKKRSKKQLSEYNLFMKRQLRAGKTFKQAVKLWVAYKRGKPIIKRVKAKPKVIVRTRTIVKRVKAKPKVIVRTRTIVKKVPVIRTRTIVKKAPAVRTVVKRVQPEEIIEDAISESAEPSHEAEAKASHVEMSSLIRKKMTEEDWMNLSDEEVAIRLVTVYFQEVHRLGLRRRMELKDVVEAYYDTLAKIKGHKNHPATQETHTIVHTH